MARLKGGKILIKLDGVLESGTDITDRLPKELISFLKENFNGSFFKEDVLERLKPIEIIVKESTSNETYHVLCDARLNDDYSAIILSSLLSNLEDLEFIENKIFIESSGNNLLVIYTYNRYQFE